MKLKTESRVKKIITSLRLAYAYVRVSNLWNSIVKIDCLSTFDSEYQAT